MPAYSGRDGSVTFADPGMYGTNVFDWNVDVSRVMVETTSPDDGAFTTWEPSIVRWGGQYSAYLDTTASPRMPTDSGKGVGQFSTGQDTLQGDIIVLRHRTSISFDGVPMVRVTFRGSGEPTWV